MHPHILVSSIALVASLSVHAAPVVVDPIAKTPVVTKQPEKIHADLHGAKQLFLVVTDAGDGVVADWADWMEPVLIKADGAKIKLTELKPKSAQVGFGQLGVNVNATGQPMRVQGQAVEFGFATHAPAMVAFDLPEGVVAFEARCGIDNGGTDQGAGSVQFLVFNDEPPRKLLNPSGDAAISQVRYGLEAAKAAMANFTTPAGLKASLFAAEPMIQNPTNLDIDHRGRVWATECVDYRKYLDLRPEGDAVVILEDTDGDGLADKEITFYQSPELTNPLGICVIPGPGGGKGGQRAIVSAAPNVWLLTDTDGDDKADKAQVLFKIGGVWNYDHQVHAFSFGPDGKLYFNAGNSITELTWPDGKIVKDMAGNEITNKGTPYRQGMVFRCDVDLERGVASNVETLGWNFRNNYEVAVDSFGTMWQSDNDDDGNKGVRINFVMDYGNYGYTDEITGAGWRTKRTNLETEIPKMHWHQNDPGTIPNLLQTGAGSPTGILVNEGTLLGAQFTNQIIHCDAGPRTVRAYPVKRDGAGYTAEMVDILTSTDSWYRPSDCAIANDGSLLVADWYDPGVGGHAMGDHEKGKIMGRIYRVAPEGSKLSAPKVDVSMPEGAVAALSSANRVTRALGWAELHAMGSKAEPALLTLWQSENPRLRARAVQLLARLPGKAAEYIWQAAHDANADLRIVAIRMAREIRFEFTQDAADGIGSLLIIANELLDDPSPEVRREVAIALRGQTNPVAADFWAMLAQHHDGKDRWLLESLGTGSVGHEDACFETWLAAIGDKWNTPAGRDIVWRVRAAKSPGYLAKILADESVSANEKPRFLRAFDFLPASTAKDQALLQLASLGAKNLEVSREALMRLKGSQSPEIARLLTGTLAKAKGTPAFVELVADFGATGQGQALLDTALAIGSDPAAVEAVKLVLEDRDSDPILGQALAGPRAVDILNLLGASGSKRGLNRLIGIVTNSGAKHELPAFPRAAVQALARTQAGAEALIAIAKSGKLAEELKPAAASALRLVQYASLKTDIDSLFPAPASLGGKALAPISELMKLKGDAAKGRAIFERAESSCIICHRVDDKGVDFGPALSEIGSKLPKEAIFDSIINPNAGLSMGFETVQLTLKKSGIGMGIVRSETNDEVILALPGGATQKFSKGDIKSREKLTTSMMPSGLNQALTQDDLVNLVEYLSTLKKK